MGSTGGILLRRPAVGSPAGALVSCTDEADRDPRRRIRRGLLRPGAGEKAGRVRRRGSPDRPEQLFHLLPPPGGGGNREPRAATRGGFHPVVPETHDLPDGGGRGGRPRPA